MIKRLPASRIALIAILTIIWHALMPLAHAMSAGQGLLSSICSTGSVSGQSRYELIQLPSSKQDAPAVDLLKQCPLCASGAHAVLTGDPARGFVPAEALAHVQTPAISLAARHALPWLHFSSRAPPQA